ncbi:hypothetical protein LCGC14_1528690 [marine sediment metagenome]|uniref:Transcription factor zinc-finger domain-containing protein n=1 Tax=marine sediment metagenome TaxID=412755 RepID=A0A0F9LC32_9ZZZZ
MTTKVRPLQCMECGKKLTLRQAERAVHGDGCPRCGGSDIDTADYQPRPVATDEGCGTCGRIECAGERLAF